MANESQITDKTEAEAEVEAEVRHSITPQHLWAARHFTRLCTEREKFLVEKDIRSLDLPHRSYAMSAVMSATAFLESLINDVYTEAADPTMRAHSVYVQALPPSVVTELAAWWNATEGASPPQFRNLFKKLDRVATEMEKDPLDGGEYDAMDDLIQLRNRLVHYKASWESSGTSAAIAERLRDKFPENAQQISTPWFPHRCLGAGSSEWACKVVVAYANAWLTHVNLPSTFESTIESFGTPA